MDDGQLIAEIKRRNQEAMVQLYQRYANLIYSIAYRVLNDEGGAEECSQDVFLRVWQRIDQYDAARGAFATWLSGIARNMAIDRLRQTARRVTAPYDLLSDDGRPAFEFLQDWADRDRAQSLRAMVEKLPTDQVQVIALSYYGGMTQSEIAAHLGIPLGTVKTRMRSALQKLRDAWGQE